MKYIIVILAVFCMTLGLSWWNDTLSWNLEREYYILNDSSLQHKILDIRDSAGRQVQVYQVQTITSQQLATSRSAEAEQLRYQLKLAGGKPNQVTSSTTTHTTTQGNVQITTHDTISCLDTGIYSIAFADTTTDSFMRLTGTTTFRAIPKSLVMQSVGIAYELKGGTSITYFNKSRLLHKAQLEVVVTELNPKTTTNKVQTYNITPKQHLHQKWYTHIIVGAAAVLVAQHLLR